jgi:hypothetical protein
VGDDSSVRTEKFIQTVDLSFCVRFEIGVIDHQVSVRLLLERAW